MSKKKIFITIVIASIVLAAFLIFGFGLVDKSQNNDNPVYEVQRGNLNISFIESGAIKARDQVVIKNEVEGRTTIIKLVAEGTEVKKGDLLVRLDSSELEERKVDQEIRVQNAEASFIRAKENLAVVENQARSDIDLATLDMEFAKQDLQKYVEGEYPYDINNADAEIQLAQEELQRAQERLKWSRQLAEENYISKTELQADEIAANKRALDVELAKKRKELLTDYTYKRQLAQLESDVSQAEMALERTERKAREDVIQAEVDLKAKEAEFTRQTDRLDKIKDQISKTEIFAPTGGLVIYATSAQSRGWGRVEPLEEGQQVRERQELIHLPSGNAMNAEITIHESNLEKTRLGLPVIITVDAQADKAFYGKISKIAPLPNAQNMFLNPDLKVYDAVVEIENNDGSLRSGMGCQAEIIVEQYEDVLFVPLQAVVRIDNEPVVYIQQEDEFVPEKVVTGMDNNKMIHIKEGLKVGDVVLLTPPLEETQSGDGNANTPRQSSDYQDKIKDSIASSKKAENQNEKEGGKKPEKQGRKKIIDLKNIDPAKLEEMKKKFKNMTPEQREKLRKQFQNRGQ